MNFRLTEFKEALFSNKGYIPVLLFFALQMGAMFLFAIGMVVLFVTGVISFSAFESPTPNPETIMPFIGVFLLSLLLFIPVGIYLQASLLGSLGDVVKTGQFNGVKSFFKNGLTYFWRYLGFSILSGILTALVIGPVIAGVIFLFIGLGDSVALSENVGSFLFTMLIFALSMYTTPLMYVAILEKNRVWANYGIFIKKEFLTLTVVGVVLGAVIGIPYIGPFLQILLIPLPLYLMVIYVSTKQTPTNDALE